MMACISIVDGGGLTATNGQIVIWSNLEKTFAFGSQDIFLSPADIFQRYACIRYFEKNRIMDNTDPKGRK
ncbi:hypothetical protein DSCO28_33410 [Desulfosarcina ovata subsp. sediminis]|uniref:Uncharacterized protein n=1 Tax=Desulfosarcina ovata subsp. sediminis TaxID=885957 RepID=A0A5K7ZPG8_9BACT|nr:hypothetical protein DSCO28_33410 [Desulfosarcina ovata subsp. sediminis]